MNTILIVVALAYIAVVILLSKSDNKIFLFLTVLIFSLGLTCGVININMSKTKGVEVATPAKYTSQTYYIDNSKRLYIQQNDITKPFGEDISSKIEYSASAKEPAIEFKTIKSVGAADAWIPFKHKEVFKTSVSKVTLPKAALTGNLTKVTILNSSQSDASNLALVD